MYKFIALIWNEDDALVQQAAEFIENKIQQSKASWKNILDASGLKVFHAGEVRGEMQAVHLQNSDGVILGKIFKTSGGGDYSTINNNIEGDEAQKIIKSTGNYLIEHYWGRYVAFLIEKNSGRKMVLKGPVEGFFCYYVEYHGVTVYFSHFEDITQLDFLKLSMNWEHVVLHLKYFKMDKIDTAFNELYKLQPGESRKYSGGQVTSYQYWDPVCLSQKDCLEDPREAAELLRRTVINCVSAWANSYDRIIHKLSGGLDSSIVLACLMLSREASDITCLNYFPSSDKSGDERYFARQVARYYGVQLIEKKLNASKVRLECLFDISPLPTPELYMNAVDRCNYEAELMRNLEASVLFAGEGGDGIFFQPRTHFITSDFLQKYGFNADLFPVALNNARLMKKSLWAVLYDALKDRLVNSRGHDMMVEGNTVSPLLNQDLMQSIKYEDTLNPSIFMNNGLSNGKRLHISLCELPNIYHYTAKTSSFFESCYPLLSQPIIECCLRIPSYILTVGGKDRGLTRMAFRNDLPAQVLRRESKGGIENYAQEIVDGNVKFVREVLLDGILVKEKLLNSTALEQALGESQAMIKTETINILRHVCTEVWLRKSLG